jgi:hypothetical protein
MFQSSVTVDIGDGRSAKFWTDSWLPEGAICRFVPHLFNAVAKRQRHKTVREAITNRSWVRDIRGARTAHVLCDYVLVWEKVQGVTFDDLSSDRFIWRWTADGTYSASSAYRAFFVGMATLRGAKELWKVRASPKCKFFFWLLLHDRLWTTARRKRHGRQDDDVCIFCDQEQETARHLAGECVYSREVWYRVLAPSGLAIIVPSPGIDFLDWWLSSRAQLPSEMRKGFDSLVILGSWLLWKERNRRVFNGITCTLVQLVVLLQEEAERWSMAGYSALAALWALSEVA